MVNVIKRLLERSRLVLIAAAIIAVFHYFGGFREPGSILLGAYCYMRLVGKQ
jgi:hypothetical protein